MPEHDSVTARPFTTFNFRVRIELGGEPLCNAAFSACNGLEMTMEPETHREGGNNVTEYKMIGPVTYGQVTLRRGMTETYDLWGWFDQISQPTNYRTRARTVVEMLPSEGNGDQSPADVRFTLHKCLPVKLSAPDLNASEGGVAIEEMQLTYERLDVEIPEASSNGPAGPISRSNG
ncbi:MAG: phage tail protein [Salinibacter sp.]|uniref:phage tail protein n=1 Tax=Salinibacter sp. TaxID=2065818 RepID=UPI002FC3B4E0